MDVGPNGFRCIVSGNSNLVVSEGRVSRIFFIIVLIASVLAFSPSTPAQSADDYCSEWGITPSFDSPFARIPYVFGRVVVLGLDPSAKLPKVSVTLHDLGQSAQRQTLNKSGKYCFKLSSSSSGSLVIEVDGIEMDRRTLTTAGGAQRREDFEITMRGGGPAPAGTINARYQHPRNDKTVELYKKLDEADQKKNADDSTKLLKQIVAADPADFLAWARLGSRHLENKSLADAEAAFRKAIESKQDYAPAWVYFAMVRMEQKQYEAAIEILKHAAELEPANARAFQLLGESYLQTRQGTLGVEALNEAIRLDPNGMAECHLQLAHLYELAGAKDLAVKEYKLFLEKRPEHPDKKKIEKLIKANQ